MVTRGQGYQASRKIEERAGDVGEHHRRRNRYLGMHVIVNEDDL
jgi:hypothetical protein